MSRYCVSLNAAPTVSICRPANTTAWTLAGTSLVDWLSPITLQRYITALGLGRPFAAGRESCQCYPFHLSAVNNNEDFLETLLHNRTECPTVIISPAAVDMAIREQPEVKTPLATPNLTMVGTFSPTDLSPPPRFAEAWTNCASFPFTFSVNTTMSVLEAQRPQQPSPRRSRLADAFSNETVSLPTFGEKGPPDGTECPLHAPPPPSAF